MAEAPWRQAVVPPPPPLGASGSIPSARLKSEVSDKKEPPICVQNAMLTKDKKPFTYTPGGIDLSEIRSPRMARRLERNAMNEGVSSVPQTTYQSTDSLPPSVLAAMQPQLSVQVFPTGGIPQCGPPPPPPPPAIKTAHLPTDCYNRPDMTKIIPENPMRLLRKTAGPVVKQDPILNKVGGPITNNVTKVENVPIKHQQELFGQSNYNPINIQPIFQQGTETCKPIAGVGSIYVPSISDIKQADSPPISYAPLAYYKRQPSVPQPESPKPSTPESPHSPKHALSKSPAPWLTQRRQHSKDIPEWAVNDQRVQSPPVAQEQVMQREEPQQIKLMKPRQQEQSEIQLPCYQPPQAQPSYQEHQQVQSPQNQRPPQQGWSDQLHQHHPGLRKLIQSKEHPQEYYPPERTEVVIVNEPPEVYHHPGQRITRPQNSYQQNKQDDSIRIIPVQIEARSNGQAHQAANSDARSFNRQLSWNSTPTQSNTFRVLQKITQTDGADDDDQVAIEHSPKMYQQYPQRQTSMDERKWNHNDSNQALMGTFKQVPQASLSQVSGPKVRTIPIEIEGNGSTKNYVPPSEQTVQEPKKYMGSSIPSRSFKILQAMTTPDVCVNPDQACENNENYSNDPSSYTQWGFNPNLPPPTPYGFDPYWSYYAQTYYTPTCDTHDSNCKMAPWHLYPLHGSKDKSNEENKRNHRAKPLSGLNDEYNKAMRAPTPSVSYHYPNDDESRNDLDATENHNNYMPYPPYWNPYYYNYYYGMPPPMYPPMYSPYHFYPPQSDTEEVSGYSSNEEMAYYGARFASMPPFARPQSNVPQENQQRPQFACEQDGETSDSDAEMISYEICRKTTGLQTIRSVSDVKVYEEYSDDDSDNTTEENENLCDPEDVIPHQLSVIFEESEKTDSVKVDRESSVSTSIGEGSATIENSDEEDAEEAVGTVFVKLPLTLKFVVAESQKVATITVGDSEVVPQTAVCSSIEDYFDKCKTETLHLENNIENIIRDTDGVDWWNEITKHEFSDHNKNDDENMNELKNSESGIDFWAHIKRDASTAHIYSMTKKLSCESKFVESAAETETNNTDEEKSEIDFWAEINNVDKANVNEPTQDESSTCSSNSSLSRSTTSEKIKVIGLMLETSSTKASTPIEEVTLTTQERIKSLQNGVSLINNIDDNETEVIVKGTTQQQNNQLGVDGVWLKTNPSSCMSSIKSYEGYSEEEEEEGDSGVTSDVSRHVSEVETDLDFYETRRINQYQRASTHSRLFKLLQDECDGEAHLENETKKKTMTQRRDCLTLPLRQTGSDPESFSSSGFTSPGSPTINDKIVNEIIQKLVVKKQGSVLKHISMEKFQSTALKILQEDMDGLETFSSSEEGGTSLPFKKNEIANTSYTYDPQEYCAHFNDYSQYDSWSDGEKHYDSYDILPSKAFKLLQEHSVANRTGAIAGLLARCPRVLSNKNVQKELMKLIESQSSPSSSPEPPEQSPNVNDANSAS